jgi:hypothetical protein
MSGSTLIPFFKVGPMTTIALNLPSGSDYPRRRFTRLALNLINGFREARDVAHRYEQLSHLSDAELAARDMRREDLPRIALTGRG